MSTKNYLRTTLSHGSPSCAVSVWFPGHPGEVSLGRAHDRNARAVAPPRVSAIEIPRPNTGADPGSRRKLDGGVRCTGHPGPTETPTSVPVVHGSSVIAPSSASGGHEPSVLTGPPSRHSPASRHVCLRPHRAVTPVFVLFSSRCAARSTRTEIPHLDVAPRLRRSSHGARPSRAHTPFRACATRQPRSGPARNDHAFGATGSP